MHYTEFKHRNGAKSSLKWAQNLFLIVAFLFATVACGDSNTPVDKDFKYIESIEVVSPKAAKVKVDNFANFIEIDFEAGTTCLKLQ